MSGSELDDVQTNRWFDSEAELPEISSINSTPQPGVNMGQFSIPDKIPLAKETRMAV